VSLQLSYLLTLPIVLSFGLAVSWSLGDDPALMRRDSQVGSATSARAMDRRVEARACPEADDWPGGVPSASVGGRPHRVTFGALCIGVPSNGCTDRSSFNVTVSPGDGITGITLTRLQPDACRMKSHRVWLEFSWSELGLDGSRPVVVEEHAVSAPRLRQKDGHQAIGKG